MKTAKFTLMFLACSAAFPVLAQSSSPQCGSNFDQGRNVFTVMNATADAVNQQCFLTVIPSGTTASRENPGPYLVEGSYVVELSGGGGGGGGGASGQRERASRDGGGGGGGGAGAAPSQTVQYFSPGIYRLTIGTGGDGGSPNGGLTEDGNPTSVTNAHTGQLMAGFPGAEVWRQSVQPAGSGRGGVAQAGASSGQDGQIGSGSNAGGSGGAGIASGGAGDSARRITVAGIGDLGGGGGGGRGGVVSADPGGRGGHGFVRLALQTAAAPAAQAPTGAVGATQVESAPAPVARPMRRDRN